MVGRGTGGTSGDGGARHHWRRGSDHAKKSENGSVPEATSSSDVAGGKQGHQAQIPHSAGSQFVEQQRGDAGRIARGTPTDFGIPGGDRQKGFEHVLLATCVFGNVKWV